MSGAEPLVAVLHGVNLDQLGNRDPALYGTLTLAELQARVAARAQELGIRTEFFQSNHEGALIEHLHSLRGRVDAAIVNAGAWSHYSWAIRDALEIAGVPALEIHLSDVQAREHWRRQSVLADLCFATISGRGAGGYDEALELVRERLAGDEP
jgi:3-dehydroquinate dehydratase-2